MKQMNEIIDRTYFKAKEILYSEKALENNIDNTPMEKEVIDNLNFTLAKLNEIRDGYGKPIYITSGYRCNELNKIVGGVENSKHKKGLAVDLKWDYELLVYIIENCKFEKLIREKKGDLLWIHIQFNLDESKNQCKILYF